MREADGLRDPAAIGAGRAPSFVGHRVSVTSLKAMGALGVEKRVGDLGPVVPGPVEHEVGAFTDQLSLDSLAQVAQTAPLSDLEQARDDAVALRNFASAFSSVAKRTVGEDFGFDFMAEALSDDVAAALVVVPVLVVLRRDYWSHDSDELLVDLRRLTPAFKARSELLDSLSPAHQRLLGVDAARIAMLPAAEREESSAAVNDWIETHPDEEELLTLV
jgi:hypothetical protein